MIFFPRLASSVFIYFLMAASARAGVFDGKSSAYFVDHYGPAKSSKTVSSASFVHVGRGAISIKGPFSAREFRKGDLIVQPIFYLPSLELAVVRLQMNHQWTEEQIVAALAAYGGEWKPAKKGVVTYWVAPDGSMAISMLTWLDILSKPIVDMVAKTVAEDDAKRKAIPKF